METVRQSVFWEKKGGVKCACANETEKLTVGENVKAQAVHMKIIKNRKTAVGPSNNNFKQESK